MRDCRLLKAIEKLAFFALAAALVLSIAPFSHAIIRQLNASAFTNVSGFNYSGTLSSTNLSDGTYFYFNESGAYTALALLCAVDATDKQIPFCQVYNNTDGKYSNQT